MSKAQAQSFSRTIIAYIALNPMKYGGSFQIRGERHNHRFSYNKRYNELTLDGTHFDLSDDAERKIFEEICKDIMSESHEGLFPIVKLDVAQVGNTVEKSNIMLMGSVQQHAADRGFDLENPDDFKFLTATGSRRGEQAWATKMDIERAMTLKQAAFSRVGPRYDPKGPEALSDPSALPKVEVDRGISGIPDGAGNPVLTGAGVAPTPSNAPDPPAAPVENLDMEDLDMEDLGMKDLEIDSIADSTPPLQPVEAPKKKAGRPRGRPRKTAAEHA